MLGAWGHNGEAACKVQALVVFTHILNSNCSNLIAFVIRVSRETDGARVTEGPQIAYIHLVNQTIMLEGGREHHFVASGELAGSSLTSCVYGVCVTCVYGVCV